MKTSDDEGQRAKKHDQKFGVTFVEIVCVLVILGILLTVPLPDFFNYQEQIRNKLVDNVI